MTITFTFTKLKENFQEALISSPNPKLLIQREIDEVLTYVNTIPNYRELRRLKKPVYEHKQNSIFIIEITSLSRGLFNFAFNENSSASGKLDIRKVETETTEAFEHRKLVYKLGNEFFKYYKWLTEILVKKQTIGKAGALTLNQKVLAMEYLGVNISSADKTKMSKLLGTILGMDAQNIRECLTYINTAKNEVRTKKNLNSIHQLFENQDFFEIANKIQKDIENLS